MARHQAPAEELTRPTLDQQAVDDDFRRLREENAKLHNMVVEEEMRRVQGALDAIEQKFQSQCPGTGSSSRRGTIRESTRARRRVSSTQK